MGSIQVVKPRLEEATTPNDGDVAFQRALKEVRRERLRRERGILKYGHRVVKTTG